MEASEISKNTESNSQCLYTNSINSQLSRLGSRGIIDRNQFVRIIIQSLYSLGYSKAAGSLEAESGVILESNEYASLLFDVMSGRWESVISTINIIPDVDMKVRASASFLVWKQHFLELVGSNQVRNSIDVLRKQISPLSVEKCMKHSLAQLIVSFEGREEVRGAHSVVVRRIGLVLDLIELLPPWIRIPQLRLEHLVEAAVFKQIESCEYHNSPKTATLYEDHKCSSDQIPSTCSQILYNHKNEVWFVQFSHNGKYLASSSSDFTAIIWTVEENDTVSFKHSLADHEGPVSLVSWSPDDTKLLSLGTGKKQTLKLWDSKTGSCLVTLNCQISSCAWFPTSDKILCASSAPDNNNSNKIFSCDLEGNKIHVWEGERIPKVSDLVISNTGQLFMCADKDIWVCEFPMGKERVIREEHTVSSLSLSKDGEFFIVNLNSQEIHLRQVDQLNKLPDKFKGHKQDKYVIRSCFGGFNCSFIASGSEDSKVYIWRRGCENPIKVLNGHLSTVNSVTWNHEKPHMLASASDDHTIRIWLANKCD